MATQTLVKGARTTQSTIFLKIVMAVSGLIFIGYVLLHMYGNLKAFAGQDAYDTYAHHLRTIGEPMLPYTGLLWIVRIVLILALIAHVYSASQLWKRANQARSTKYAVKKNLHSSLSSRWMRWGGITLLLFVIWHLVHFTVVKPTLGGDYSATAIKDSPYQMLLNSFAPEMFWVTAIYLIALCALAMHLHHGVWSAMQTLGFTNTPKSRERAKLAGIAVAIVVAGGFALVPLAITFGIIN